MGTTLAPGLNTASRRTRTPAPTTRSAVLSVNAAASRTRATDRLGLPFFVFCSYTFILIARPQDYVPALAPLRLALVFTVLTCIVTWFTAGTRPERLLQHRETKLYFFFFATMCAGIPFSIYRRASFEFVFFQYAVNVVFYVLFVMHVNSVVKYRRIAFVLALSTLTFSVFGLSKGQFIAGRYFLPGSMFDPNDVVFVVLSLLPFALCMLFGPFRLLSTTVGLIAVLLSILFALYTGSRGGAIGLGVFLLTLLAVRVPGVGKSHKGMMLVLLAAVTAFNLGKINVDRYLSIAEVASDYNVTDEFGRAQVWRRGLDLFSENPLTGVGAGRFGEAIGTMRREEDIQQRWQAPHNSYVQVFTETGVFGAGAFVTLVVTCAGTFHQLGRRMQSVEDRSLAVLPPLLLVGIIAQSVTAIFLSQAYSMLFTLSFVAAAALRGISPNQASDSVARPTATAARPRR